MKILLDYDVMLEIIERLDRGESRFDDLKDNGDVVTLYLDGPEDDAEGKAVIYDFEKGNKKETVGQTMRICTLDGKTDVPYLFHGWFTEAYIVYASPRIGGRPGGSIQTIYALVENIKTGNIKKAEPTTVKFVGTNSQWVYGGKPIHCERCGYTPEYSLNKDNSSFCPNCGAKMDGVK